jgi:TPP-dependent indolepyruvate ferredoxin oxidoreductase alpha subunit
MGVSFPLTIENSRELFIGLTEILSLAESKEVIEKHFKDLINDIYI